MLARLLRALHVALAVSGLTLASSLPAAAQQPKSKPPDTTRAAVTPQQPACTVDCGGGGGGGGSGYNVSVTPDGAWTPTRPPYTGGWTASFTVQNTGTTSNTFAMSCGGLTTNVTCTALSPTSVSLLAGASRTVTTTYSVGEAGTGGLRLQAVGTSALDAGYYNVPVKPPYGVAVTPDGASTPERLANTGGYSATFTVQNSGSESNTYTLSCGGSPNVTCTGLSATSVPLATGASATVTATYSVGAPGSGTLTLTAVGTSASDGGSYTVPVVSYGVAVTPDGATTATRAQNAAGYAEVFTVRNTGSKSNTYTLSCAGAAPVTCTGTTPTSLTLAGGATSSVTASYSTGPAGTGRLTLAAAGTQASDTGFFSVPVVAPPAVTPDGQAVVALANASNSQRFTVQNPNTSSATYTLTASCAGTATGCTVSPASITVAPGDSSPADVAYQTGNLGSTGSVSVTATLSTEASVKDSGWVTVSLGTAQAPSVDVASVNPGALVERDVCLTIAAGAAAAYECGDLRIVHPLPTTRTLNKARTPTLLYNSQQAHPYPLVAANVTLASGSARPDSVVATLRFGTVVKKQQSWRGSNWGSGATRRIVVGYDGLADTTGIYSYTLEVVNWYNTNSRLTTVTGQLPIVNRKASPFGAGWWLAGLERLNVADMRWVGGDGSVRQYQLVTTSVWGAPNVDRPDTLKWDGTNYVRILPHGVRVKFDAQGRHVATVNRLGHRTTFNYIGTSDTLATIVLPPTGLAYQFSYVSATRWVVTAPSLPQQTRADTGTLSAGRLMAIRGPDTSRVSFTYASGNDSNLVWSRTDRRGYRTTYSYNAGNRLIQSSLDMGVGQTAIVRQWRPVETLGYPPATAQAVDTALAYARYDGPRLPSDVGDTTLFWVDRFGAPRRIRDALGNDTRLTRDQNWPAAVTRVRYPNGRIVGAVYDSARADLLATTDSSNVQNGRYATTTYRWDPTWDFVTAILPPENDSIAMAYDPATGNRIWQQDARGASSRVNFSYNTSGPASGLLSSLRTPSGGSSSFFYDALGNLDSTQTPKGFWSVAQKDAIGRDVLQVSPVDSSQTVKDTTRLYYDAFDRDTLSRSVGPRVTIHFYYTFNAVIGRTFTAAAETVTVRKVYDPNGNLLQLWRKATPDINGIGWGETEFVYDRAGRKTIEITSDTGTTTAADTTAYDPAGNAVAWHTRRSSSGQPVVDSTIYDPLNRVSKRITGVTRWYKWEPDAVNRWIFPRYSTPYSLGPDTATFRYLGPDTATFSYDAMGNLVAAKNADALVERGYNRNGALAADTLKIRTYAPLAGGGDTTSHVYVLSYDYDLDGRRIALHHPANVAPLVSGAPRTLQQYTYTVNGELATVTDVLGNQFRWHYDVEGRPDTLYFPPGASQPSGHIYDARQYDTDGRLVTRLDYDDLFSGTDSGFGRSAIHADTLWYDGRSKALLVGGTDHRFYHGYTALGNIARSAIENLGPETANEQGYAPDALGNNRRTWSSTSPSLAGPDSTSTVLADSFYAHTGRFWQYWPGVSACFSCPIHDLIVRYDSAGNRYREIKLENNPNGLLQEAMQTYFDAANRIRVADRRSCVVPPSGNTCNYGLGVGYAFNGTFEEYRYDALGRRVLVRSRADTTCQVQGVCESAIKRFIYDGDQVLYEIRQPGSDSLATTLLERDTASIYTSNHGFGRVVYTHGPGIDHPLDVIRMGYSATWPMPIALILHYTWRDVPDVGSFDNGAAKRCHPNTTPSDCVLPSWAAYNRGAYLEDNYPQQYTPAPIWFGDLAEMKRDATGQLYMRNRSFDPATGHFTQEDPLGLAGGLNVYGFAGGDPVNFSDPFGLKADTNIVYDVKGDELSRSGTDPKNNYFLSLDGGAYGLDYGLEPGNTAYELHTDPGALDREAVHLAGQAPAYGNLTSIGLHSLPGGRLDFKTRLNDRSLWNAGGGLYVHKHAVGNAAWGNYMARRGYGLGTALRGAAGQGLTRGGEDPLDQLMITRGYNLWPQ